MTDIAPKAKELAKNRELWELVFKTDPAHVKAITGKDYTGNSPKPHWIVGRATEVFGPCGIGWGFTVSNERFEQWGENDVAHACLVTVWYKWNGERGEVCQMGQTKAAYKTNAGKFKVDEDAAKKSVTDGMVKALSLIGFAGDIFSGRWDDSKYQTELREDAKAEKLASEIPGNNQAPKKMPSNATLGDAEFKEVNRLLDECGGDKRAFADHFGAQSVAGIPLARYAEAVGILKTRIRKQQQAMAAAQQQQGPEYDPGQDYFPIYDSANQAVEFE